MKILPKNLAKGLEFQKIRICNSCQGYFHPEESLYFKINFLEEKIKKLEEENIALMEKTKC
jgi:hypothetical protein